MTSASHRRSLKNAWRLSAALLLPRLLQQLKGDALSPRDDPALIADLLDILRDDPGFDALGQALLETDGRARGARFLALWPEMRQRLSARGHHHLALLNLRWGWEALGEAPKSLDASALRGVTRRWQQALRHFAPTLADPDFLNTLAIDVGAAEHAEGSAEQVVQWLFEPHGDALIKALEEPGAQPAPLLKVHWQTLADGPALLAADLADGALKQRVLATTDLWRRRVIDRALSMADEQAQPVEATDDDRAALLRPFDTLRWVTDILGPHEDLSVWALDKAVVWAWPLYKTKAETRLKDLLDASKPFATHVESLLQRHAGAFGRQGVLADHILFMADFHPAEEQAAMFRRAMTICPGHRNSRLMLSYHQVNLARRALLKAEANDPLKVLTNIGKLAAREAIAEAEAHLDEAEELFPDNERLAEYRQKVAALRERFKVT